MNNKLNNTLKMFSSCKKPVIAYKNCSYGILLIAIINISSCAIPTKYIVGANPNSNIMETTLVLGESTMDDVTRYLGNPSGNGGLMLPIDSESRTIWSYYYEKGSVLPVRENGKLLRDTNRTFLFVYFDEDNVYDGYMWFSSL